jgi:hypothetical protein
MYGHERAVLLRLIVVRIGEDRFDGERESVISMLPDLDSRSTAYLLGTIPSLVVESCGGALRFLQ